MQSSIALRCWVTATLLVAGCGPEARSAETAPSSSQANRLALADLSFFDRETPVLLVHADGRVEARIGAGGLGQASEHAWRQLAVLTADGAVTHDSKLIGQLQPDETFSVFGRTRFRFEGNALVIGAYHITIDDQGIVHGGAAGRNPPRVQGAKDDRSRRTALLVLALFALDRLVEIVHLDQRSAPAP